MTTKKEVNIIETKLSGHKRDKKQFHPPLTQIKFTPSSWINDRKPDMLWAVLIIGHWDRNEALNFFRHASSFAEDCL